MICLGFDPGPTECGYCALESRGGTQRPSFFVGGKVPSQSSEIAALICKIAWDAAMRRSAFVVGIEAVVGYAYEGARSAALHQTSEVAGLIKGLCAGLSVPTESLSAASWRKQMCGKANAGDPMIKRAFQLLIEGVPKSSNVHVRDAAGIAFVVLQLRLSALRRTA